MLATIIALPASSMKIATRRLGLSTDWLIGKHVSRCPYRNDCGWWCGECHEVGRWEYVDGAGVVCGDEGTWQVVCEGRTARSGAADGDAGDAGRVCSAQALHEG